MRLYTVGPVAMLDEIKAVGGEQVPYFRTDEFSNLMLDTDSLLKKMLHTSEQSKVIYLTASGSGAMEAAVINCFTRADHLLIINGGTFGQRFVDICEMYAIPYEQIQLPYGEELTKDHFDKYEHVPFTGVLVNIDETYTGQLYDIKLISNFCKRKNLYLVVDAISSFLCDPYDMDRYGIDVTIISSQKGLCVAPGMSMVILSERMVENRVKNNKVQSLYFDFKDYIKNFIRGQTPFTPAVGICMQINKVLHVIEEKTLEKHLANIAILATDFRKKVQELPVSVPEYRLSNAITPIVFSSNIAFKVFLLLKNKYDIMLNPIGGALHEKALRVSHIGNLDICDNDYLLNYLKVAINEVAQDEVN